MLLGGGLLGSMPVSFAAVYSELPITRWVEESRQTSPEQVDSLLRRGRWGVADFAQLISPAAGERLEHLGRISQALTQ